MGFIPHILTYFRTVFMSGFLSKMFWDNVPALMFMLWIIRVFEEDEDRKVLLGYL